jgi:syntaxin 1B/2/3
LDENSSRQIQSQIDDLVSETRTLGNSLRERIQKLAAWPAKGRNAEIRNNQVRQNLCSYCESRISIKFAKAGVLKSKFMDALQRYQKMEQQHREKQRERVARQFKIVKQDATPEEIAAVVDDSGPGSNQIFAQAVRATGSWFVLLTILPTGFFVHSIQRSKNSSTRCPGKARGPEANRADPHRANAAI